MKTFNFPRDFFWGGAVSAEQTEGKGITPKAPTVYYHHFKSNPTAFFDNQGPLVTSDFMNHFQADIKLWKQLGLNSHRTSLSWARLFPDGDYDRPNQAAVAFYHGMIDLMKAQGIEPFITLFHFDMPWYAYQKGSYESREVWEDFCKYAAFVLQEYGAKVKYFSTMNEPWVPVHVGYVDGLHWPCLKDPQRAVNAAYGIVMMHAKVVNYFNDNIKPKFASQLGAIFNCQYVYPKDANNLLDLKASHYASLYQFIGMTDAMVLGKWNKDLVTWIKKMDLMPKNFRWQDLRELSRIKIDIIGLNFYAPMRVQAPQGNGKNIFENYFQTYMQPNRRENKFRGWEIYPDAIFDTFSELVKRYGNDKSYMLTEFGMGAQNEAQFRDKHGIINDHYRIAFLQEHLIHLHRFMQSYPKVKVLGAHVWATYDCWSWNNGYKNTYGLIEVKLDSMARQAKQSAFWFGQVAREAGFDEEYGKMEDYMDFQTNLIHH